MSENDIQPNELAMLRDIAEGSSLAGGNYIHAVPDNPAHFEQFIHRSELINQLIADGYVQFTGMWTPFQTFGLTDKGKATLKRVGVK